MKLALCNEVLGDRELADQCEYAAALGYEGLEVAPYTLDDLPHQMAADKRRDIRRTIEASGLVVSGLHWLLVIPQDLSITSADVDVRAKTRQVMCSLVTLCADLGGAVLVHGSPKQRWLSDDAADAATARSWALEAFAQAAAEAEVRVDAPVQGEDRRGRNQGQPRATGQRQRVLALDQTREAEGQGGSDDGLTDFGVGAGDKEAGCGFPAGRGHRTP